MGESSDTSESSDEQKAQTVVKKEEKKDEKKKAMKVDSSDDDSSDTSDSSSSDDEDERKEMPKKKGKKKKAAASKKAVKKEESSSDDSSSDSSDDSSDEDDDMKSAKPEMNEGPRKVIKTGSGQRFQRIKARFNLDPNLADNSYDGKDAYALKAHDALIVTQGKKFTKAKNKQKRKTMHGGGPIDVGAVNSIRFDD